ncbi:hypothetical protein EDEG_03596 [Edhazardia aedis USNM 41457]|uniref:Transcription initiation factor TFIID subunit 10 n=1 Tax=Edhazardia aedis (strain USNM 41457) TaxID=1003232 RepID=J9D2Y9_EDHAE|nr:hypothetical protein EDEG_03596 [Edhazardia aedis USNM 41457]|eukprot:EJW01939.1 hypothetical protein EDEG_03596 [Edhazardia aedis USNM 41457]
MPFIHMKNEELQELEEALSKYVPLIPEPIIDYFLTKAGISYADQNVKKYISLIMQKFLTDVSISAFQYHKVIQKAVQKDKRFAKEKKITFQVADLEKALEEMGIDIQRQFYYL